MSTEVDTPAVWDPDIEWVIPYHFHSLGLELDSPERAVHLEEVACEVWPGGTGSQRQTVAGWYADIAEAAAAAGALYAGLAFLSTDDDRISTATLTIRAESLEPAEPGVAIAGLIEVLSADPAHEVHRTQVACGPAVVVFTGLVWQPPRPAEASPQEPRPAALKLAQAEVYLPLEEAETLLVLCLSSPDLRDFPEYVGVLSTVADSVSLGPSAPSVPLFTGAQDGPAAIGGQSKGSRIEEAFG
jgi:hypothetical protein